MKNSDKTYLSFFGSTVYPDFGFKGTPKGYPLSFLWGVGVLPKKDPARVCLQDGQLVLKGRYQPKHCESLLRKYIKARCRKEVVGTQQGAATPLRQGERGGNGRVGLCKDRERWKALQKKISQRNGLSKRWHFERDGKLKIG